ncbi:MAG: hypothetical protein WKF86_05490 [Acidimicrobiales bacterium]
MPTSITYSKADGIDRNEPGVAADLLELLARGQAAWHADGAPARAHPRRRRAGAEVDGVLEASAQP